MPTEFEKTSKYSMRLLNPVGVLKYKPLAPAKRLGDLNHKKMNAESQS